MTSLTPPGRPAIFEPWDIQQSSSPIGPPAGATPPARPAPPSPSPAYAPPPASRSSAMVLDARPILLRRDDSIWARAEQARDDLYDAIMRTCGQEQVDALVVKSGPFAVPAHVSFECWVPVQGPLVTERATATIFVIAREFHTYDLEYSVVLSDRGKTKRHDHLMRFDGSMAAALIKYLLRRGPKPTYGDVKLRVADWQIWREKNEVDALERDWAVTGTSVLGMVGVVLLMTGTDASLIGGVLVAAAMVIGVFLVRRPVAVQSSGKPDAEPRTLTQVDSWQTVVPGLGADALLVRDRVLSQLRGNRAGNFRAWLEHIWYWGLEGKEDREQTVLSLGRALCFCHVYRYGNDLYVGWDGHVNYGQWVEQRIASGWSKTAQRLTEIKTVVRGFQQVSEYDLTDLNCLMEWTHSKLVEQVKQLLEERKIDAEIDFRINRGDRQGLTERQAEGSEDGASMSQRLRRRLVRTG